MERQEWVRGTRWSNVHHNRVAGMIEVSLWKATAPPIGLVSIRLRASAMKDAGGVLIEKRNVCRR